MINCLYKTPHDVGFGRYLNYMNDVSRRGRTSQCFGPEYVRFNYDELKETYTKGIHCDLRVFYCCVWFKIYYQCVCPINYF